MDVTIHPAAPIRGRVRVPGDKSISHRAAIIGAIASGETRVRGFLHADDCLHTVECLRAFGVTIEEVGGELVISGSSGRLTAPPRALNAGNSGTTMRLLSGVAAAQPFVTEIDGDASLRRRPMDRVAEPLRRMGATVEARDGMHPPLRISGGDLRGITYELPVASAQVKSAILLAGLFADGDTEIVESVPTRDHTERMLAYCGVHVIRGSGRTTLTAGIPQGRLIEVPGDISSAAFLLAGAAALEGSEFTVEDVGVNPTRTGVVDVLRAMGAAVATEFVHERSGEPVGTISTRGRRLRGVTIAGALIPRVIDELPVLCVLAAAAEGRTVIRDAAELRVKESDRIAVLARGLRTLGAAVAELSDGMEIDGGRLRGGVVDADGDHRIAMAFAVAGLLAGEPVTVRGAESVQISFPGFFDLLRALGES
jgi:3-phosphoshikimate 1-carboxyvinyltransferase